MLAGNSTGSWLTAASAAHHSVRVKARMSCRAEGMPNHTSWGAFATRQGQQAGHAEPGSCPPTCALNTSAGQGSPLPAGPTSPPSVIAPASGVYSRSSSAATVDLPAPDLQQGWRAGSQACMNGRLPTRVLDVWANLCRVQTEVPYACHSGIPPIPFTLQVQPRTCPPPR